MESGEVKVILVKDGNFEKIKRIESIKKLIAEGKVVLVSGTISECLSQTVEDIASNMEKVSRRFNAEIELARESIEALSEFMKVAEHKSYDYFPFVPIEHNFKKPILSYKYLRDKRKYRAAVNRR